MFIHVKEELPIFDKKVLLLDNSGNYAIGHLLTAESRNIELNGKEVTIINLSWDLMKEPLFEEVIYWAELPELPVKFSEN